jgi:AraC-like DNA-binding protein
MSEVSHLHRATGADGSRVCLCSWGARSLYIGPALRLSAHRNAVAVLALGLDTSFAVAANPAGESSAYRSCRSVLIFPNTLHQLRDTHGRMAFLYLDACSLDLACLKSHATHSTSRCAFDLQEEDAWIDAFDDLACERRPWAHIRRELAQRLGRPHGGAVDARIRATLDTLQDAVGQRITLPLLARRASLSPSRLRHLFKATTGVPLRRYRLWLSMGSALRSMVCGDTLTDAAMHAGFASSAHFSSSFRDMFGLEPSRLGKLEWLTSSLRR